MTEPRTMRLMIEIEERPDGKISIVRYPRREVIGVTSGKGPIHAMLRLFLDEYTEKKRPKAASHADALLVRNVRIWERHEAGESVRDMAKDYGVTPEAIRHVIRRGTRRQKYRTEYYPESPVCNPFLADARVGED